ncbi:4-(cytidine 5'-diphospho)-2-C-methyl-D-erythritol kinase [Gellertiella hungarica]|uniref:4-diphosphocytidyl-2-C-methyl-D-erythritol kinase n=1 Tax=Gellertiella hungarica TaxID=1572859 RepID=A0A7W6J5L7_9HYPH|nr:4-(cytidine 5'-diphospho)-2-C-methyl-D-erythritol kinase [Gellertiella hungarica]MBB4064353.1 4-diphosphocytidyl-2-C-methyl-D-erythritol kinase [Gellertiella hungarica]
MAPVEERAFAKVNLALHVTGQREDGYHLLDTLVTFAEAGDRLCLEPAEDDAFSLSGRFGPLLSESPPAENLVIRARDGLRTLLEKAGHTAPPVHIHLEKNLPLASGIGGGSADAAACLRGLMRLWNMRPARDDLDALALSLGADVPMCLVSRPLVARGIGEDIEEVTLPSLFMLLVNPLVPVSTPSIFRRLRDKNNSPLPLDRTALSRDPVRALAGMRNDLQPPAEEIEPLVSAALAALAAQQADLVRMSGSGATCFGLFSGQARLLAASEALRKARPDWFVEPTTTLG